MKTLISVLLGLMIWSGAATALADDIPVGCQGSTIVTRAYQSGVAQGKSLVQRAWLSVNDCDQLEHLTDIIIANVDFYQLTGSSAYNICRHTGMIDGVFQQIDAVWTLCDGLCCDEGSAIGELAAELYCQLSILLGGLAVPDDFVRRPVFECGFEFQTCCDSNFMGVSRAYEGLDLLGQVKQCLPYTEDPFFDVWDGSREIQCTYVPPPVP